MSTKEENKKENTMEDADKSQKIQNLRDMINNAEKTIQGAKAMLLQLEGKKKAGRKRKIETGAADGEQVVEGTFDGQLMIGTDGKQYPVPANYASKSKLVEGDMLKLTITPDGSFVYKQIGPAPRRHAIGVVKQDERNNFYVLVDDHPYQVLLASITYFKAQAGDEVAIVLPRDIDTNWAAIENVLQKSFGMATNPTTQDKKIVVDKEIEEWKKSVDTSGEKKEMSIEDWKASTAIPEKQGSNEWVSDID